MMMKIGGGFFASSTMLLLLLFFFNGVQFSDAVMCDRVNGIFDKHAEYEKKSCEACAKYKCGNTMKWGCPEDFFNDCSAYSQAVDYVKYYNPKKACYFDTVTRYVSGCETQSEGTACMWQNDAECIQLLAQGIIDGYGTPDYPFYSGSNGIGEGVWKLSGMILLGWIVAMFH